MALGEVLTLQRGFDLPTRDRVAGPFPVVSSSGVTGRHAQFKVRPPGVVIGRYGSLGSVHWISEPYWPLNTSLWVRDFKGNYPRFVSYLLRTVRVDGSTASAVPGVNRNHLHKQAVVCPPIGDQRRISAVLSAFDELIEVNERRIDLLEELARSLYREWFVRFRFPGHEDGELVDSELGPIPEGWEVCQLGAVITLSYGKALTARNRRPGDVPVVSSAGIIGAHDQALVEGPGIVVGRKGNVGSVWWVDEDFFPIDTAYSVASDAPLGLLYWQLRDLEFMDSHAAVPGLSREQAYGLPLLVPAETHARRFGELHSGIFESIATHRAHNRQLAATRDLLLPRLVTGRLDISDVDLGDLLPPDAETAPEPQPA